MITARTAQPEDVVQAGIGFRFRAPAEIHPEPPWPAAVVLLLPEAEAVVEPEEAPGAVVVPNSFQVVTEARTITHPPKKAVV